MSICCTTYNRYLLIRMSFKNYIILINCLMVCLTNKSFADRYSSPFDIECQLLQNRFATCFVYVYKCKEENCLWFPDLVFTLKILLWKEKKSIHSSELNFAMNNKWQIGFDHFISLHTRINADILCCRNFRRKNEKPLSVNALNLNSELEVNHGFFLLNFISN